MVLSCKSEHLTRVLSGLNPSQHVALLTQQLLHCLSHNALLQVPGSVLSLALITLELEKICPDWLAVTVDLLRKAQVRLHICLPFILKTVYNYHHLMFACALNITSTIENLVVH